MMFDQNEIDCFYKEQNMQIRRQIREMDMQLRQLTSIKSSKEAQRQEALKLESNFLVIGPNKSGKTSLLKTMHYALNSNSNVEITVSELGLTVIKKFEIKRSKRYNVEGLAKLKQTDQKRVVTGFEFESRPDSSKKGLSEQQRNYRILQKYSNAMQIIDNSFMGCFSMNPQIKEVGNSWREGQRSGGNFNIKTVLITVDIVAKTEYEEIKCLKSFIADLRQKGMKCILILTHIDKLSKIKEADRLNLIEDRICHLMKELDIKDRDDVLCLENYQTKGSKTEDRCHQHRSGPIPPKQHHGNHTHSYHQSDAQINAYNNHRGVVRAENYPKQYEGVEVSHQSQSFIQSRTSLSDGLSSVSSQRKVPVKESVKKGGSSFYTQNQCSWQVHEGNEKLRSAKTNYGNRESIHNNEEINYYSLKLLQKVIKEAEKYNNHLKGRKVKWFCGM